MDSSNNGGIWSEGSGSLALVARRGSQAPGTPSGVNYTLLGSNFVLNDAGQTAFRATLTGTGVGATNNQGIWSEGSGSLALVARYGNQAAGAPSGVNYYSFSTRLPVLNNAGQTAFFAYATTSPPGSGVNGIWSEGSGSVAIGRARREPSSRYAQRR